MSNTNPPFYPGQEVVCVDDRPHDNTGDKLLVKNKPYVVFRTQKGEKGFGVCVTPDDQELIWLASRFRPIQRHPNAEVAEELKNIEVVEERIDAPETVTA